MGETVPEEKEYSLNQQQIKDLIARIIAGKCILQCVREDYRTVYGDRRSYKKGQVNLCLSDK